MFFKRSQSDIININIKTNLWDLQVFANKFNTRNEIIIANNSQKCECVNAKDDIQKEGTLTELFICKDFYCILNFYKPLNKL